MSAKSILAYLSEAHDRTIIEEVARAKQMSVRAETGGLGAAAQAAADWRVVPEFLVLDIAGTEDVRAALETLAGNAPEGETNVILVGREDCVETYRRYKRLGVAEYLVHPLQTESLGDVLSDIMRERLQGGRSIDANRLLCVHGVRGGAGGSTLAAAVARATAQRHGKNTFLIDLDLRFGTQYLNFGRPETPGLIDMCENPARIDALFMDRSLERPYERLSLLSAHRDVGEVEVDHDTLKQVLIQAQRAADLVIVDLPFRSPYAETLMSQAGTNLLVAAPSPQGMRDTAGVVTALEKINFGGDITVALNKTGQRREGELNAAEFTKRAGLSTVYDIPYDPRAAGRAMISDDTLYAASGRIAKALDRLYAALPTAPADADRKRGLFGRR